MPSFKILVAGSVNGQFSEFFSKIDQMNSKYGPFTALLISGDFFGKDGGEYQDLIKGKIKVPLQTYIINGNNPIPEDVQSKINKTGEICESLFYLGRIGVITTSENIKIAYLSGQQQKIKKPEDLPSHSNPEPPKDLDKQYTHQEVMDWLKQFSNVYDSSKHQVDIFLTWDSPRGVYKDSSAAAKLNLGIEQEGPSIISEIVVKLKPAYVFSGRPRRFFEREPFDCNGSPVRYLSLGMFGNKNKEKWNYAMNLIPISSDFKAKPIANLSPCPLILTAASRNQLAGNKRSAVENSYFWDVPQPKQPAEKRMKGEHPPPDTYTCHICNEKGHWIQDCTTKAEKQVAEKTSMKPSQTRPAASQHDQSQQNTKQLQRQDPQRKSSQPKRVADVPCWFCLSNPDIEKNLIAHIGEEIYVTLAKGGLNDKHSLLIPLGHYPSLNHLKHIGPDDEEYESAQNTLLEVQNVKEQLRSEFKKLNMDTIIAETFGGIMENSGDSKKMMHTHLQVIPVSKLNLEEFKDTLLKDAEAQGLELLNTDYPNEVNAPYIHLETNTTDKFVFGVSSQKLVSFLKSQYDNRIQHKPRNVLNLQFVRHLMIKFMNLSKEMREWRKCVVDRDTENTWVEGIKRIFSEES